MTEFKRIYNDFNYIFRYRLNPKETLTCKIPIPSGKARSIKSITWSVGMMVEVKATIDANISTTDTLWEELKVGSVLSPSTTAMRFYNSGPGYGQVFVRVIME